jgi:cellulose synthase/poly-beta-1,6-N-acetylglucosamine synthase-like glycosyltransferase
MARGEIVILTDANTSIDPQAVCRLVRHFANPQVGAVCGHLKLYNPTLPDYEESAYWSYESLLKHYEGQNGVVMGANGGLYAIRRSLYNHLPIDTIIDDFTIPARILLAGYQVRFEPEALAYEKTTENYDDEFSRKSRISAGNFQALIRMPQLLFFLENPLASYAFWSHKFLRWLAPFFMFMALISNIFLLSVPGIIYPLLLICQVSFYTLAGISRIYGLPKMVQTAASAAYYFVYMNLALAVGFWKFIRNQQKAAWERTSR